MLRFTLFTLLLGTLASGSPFVHLTMRDAADSLGRFPHVAGRNLENESFDLPRDFAGRLNVVVVAFKREHQADVDTWMPFLNRICATTSDVRVYELPTLGRSYRFMRRFIDGGMRRGIPDAAVRATTITLYIDKTAFRRSLVIADETRIYTLLVDRDGTVHWRAAGPFDAAAGAELERRLSLADAERYGVAR